MFRGRMGLLPLCARERPRPAPTAAPLGRFRRKTHTRRTPGKCVCGWRRYAEQIELMLWCLDTEVTFCTLGEPIRGERRAAGRERSRGRGGRREALASSNPASPGDRTVGPARLGLRCNTTARGSLAGRRRARRLSPRCKRGVGPSPPACPAVAPERPWSLSRPVFKSPIRQPCLSSPSAGPSRGPASELPPFPDSAPNCTPNPAPGSTLFMPPIGPQLLPRKLFRPHRRRRGS
jgi:hypothetical protein